MNPTDPIMPIEFVTRGADGSTVEETAQINDIRYGVEIYRTVGGGYDVTAFMFTEDTQEWNAIGDAEEANNFPTIELARQRGRDIIEIEALAEPFWR